jgi:hypothetical protein
MVPSVMNEKSARCDLMDRDPRNSVLFRSVPENGEFYVDQIARLLAGVSKNVKISFEASK